MSRTFIFLILMSALACHRSKGDPNAGKPSSCLIEHDGGVTQCFEDIGTVAKTNGAKYCDEMHGSHSFRVAEGCPSIAIVGSCRKRAATDLERVERCYHDAPGCEARCAKSGGTFEK